jgi:hypothetical protein
MAIAVTCAGCGRPYEPSPAEVRAGTWRHCPACRAPRTPTAPDPAPGRAGGGRRGGTTGWPAPPTAAPTGDRRRAHD